jgi:hypothetical protein
MMEAAMARSGGQEIALPPEGAPAGAWEGFLSADAVVLSFPLYVDHLPAPLLASLELAADMARRARAEDPSLRLPRLYAMINNGFYEPAHSLHAARSLELFCRDSGLAWSGALLAGGGPFASAVPWLFRKRVFPFGRLRRALDLFAAKIGALEPAGITEVRLPLPRRLYVLIANAFWRVLALKGRVPLKRLYAPALGPDELSSDAQPGAAGAPEAAGDRGEEGSSGP